MKYVETIPTVPGWYWKKIKEKEFPVLIRIVTDINCTFAEEYQVNNWYNISNRSKALDVLSGPILYSSEPIAKPQ